MLVATVDHSLLTNGGLQLVFSDEMVEVLSCGERPAGGSFGCMSGLDHM